MRKTCAVAALLVTLPASALAQDAKTVIDAATKAMGITGMRSITYSGIAAEGNFGQSRTISFGLASTQIRNYTRTIDFTRSMARATGDAQPPAEKGATPPLPYSFDRPIASTNTAWAAQLEIWTTPWGFLIGAAANKAEVRNRKVNDVAYKVVTWSPALKSPTGQPYKVSGYINEVNLVERVETFVGHPIFGDMLVEMRYIDYRDANGIKVPARISENKQGMETFVASISAARANPDNLEQLLTGPPMGLRAAPIVMPPNFQPQEEPVTSEKLADGVYRIVGGYSALIVEFKDHLVVLEGGQSEAHGLAIIAEAKKLFPAKRIRSVVVTHPHFDHAGGIPPFVSEGATVIMDDNSKFFMEASLSQPRTLVGDTLGKTKKKPKVEGVIEKMVLQDETRTIELHHVTGLEHSDAMLIAVLPKERILFTADFNPPPPGQPASPSIKTLVANIERLKLDFDRHVMVHAPTPDRPMTKADLLALAQK